MPTIRANYQAASDFVLRKIYALEAETIRKLYGEYASAYQEMLSALGAAWEGGNLKDTWSTADVQSRQQLLRQIATIMDRLDPRATRILFDGIGDAVRAGHYGAAYTIDSSVGKSGMGAIIPLLPTDAVAAQVLSPYLGQTWLDSYQDNRTEFELRIKRALVQSQIQGESMTDARRRIALELGITPGSQLRADRQTHKRNFARTMMIARSEIIRASNLGAVAVYEANSDVLKGYEIKAANDERTCPTCGEQDGKQYEFGKGPVPPFHPACRCATVPALIDSDLEQRIVGKHVTFADWAESRGLDRNQYGQAYDLRGKNAPKTKEPRSQ